MLWLRFGSLKTRMVVLTTLSLGMLLAVVLLITNEIGRKSIHRGVEASLVASMGRMAAHTGVEITYDQMLNCPHEMAPGIADFSITGPAPVQADADGKYPIPQPGIIIDREYAANA